MPLVLNGHAGAEYGIPFPVFLRSMYGIQGMYCHCIGQCITTLWLVLIFLGSKAAAMIRALIGCGWFGIQTSIGGDAIYQMFLAVWSGFGDAPSLGDWFGLNLLEFICFMIFWAINMYVMYIGTGLATLSLL
jgi:NCS1 family nucleobase:cation symporter-1